MLYRRSFSLLRRLGLVAGSAGLLAPTLGAQETSESPFLLDPFVVTGTRTERLISEAPIKTELIVPQDMRAYNVTTFKDALKLVPTARFENECQNCGLNQIQLLGLGTNYTSVLFDGAPLYAGLAKVYGADIFPAIFIDRIEVVKGGASVLYGPEAMAGVVNLISEEPVATNLRVTGSLESLVGDALEWEGTFDANYVDPDGRFSATLYGFHQDREGLDLTTDGFTDLSEFKNTVIGTQGWWHPLPGATLKVTLQGLEQAHRGGDRLDLPEEQARVAESLEHDIQLAQATWTQRVNDTFNYALHASYMHLERTSFYGARGANEQRAYELAGFTGDVTEAFIADNQGAIDAVARSVWGLTDTVVTFLDGVLHQDWRDHTFSYGVQFRREEVEDGPLYNDSVVHSKDSFDNLGVFFQDQWAVSEQLELVPGIRLDDHDNAADRILSPRLAARYFASEHVTLRASWSTGFNAPGAFNEDLHIGVNNGGAIFLVNAPDLEEERSETYSLGAEWQPHAFDHRLTLHTQLHYTHLQDAFEIDDSGEASGEENVWLRINGPDADVWAWENNLTWRPVEHLRFDAGLSYIDARFEEEIERVTGLVTDEFLKRPDWTGHFGVAYENADLINANVLLTYTGEMLAVGEDADIWRRTDPFYVVDVGLSKTFAGVLGTESLTLHLGVENLFDERQDDLQNNGEERDPTYLYGPTQPRTWYARVSLEW